MKLRVAYGLGLVAMLTFADSAMGCPLARLARIAMEPTTSLQHKELPLRQRESTEGGKWDVYLRSDGTLHSIVRTDFGETGQRKVRASFLTKDEFAIVSMMIHYRSPIAPDSQTAIMTTNTTKYFFCKEVVFIPTVLGDESSVKRAFVEAGRLKSDFLDSLDIVSYLKRAR